MSEPLPGALPEAPPPEPADLPEPTRPGRYVLAASITLALTLVAAALLVPALWRLVGSARV